MGNAIYLPHSLTPASWGCPHTLISTGAYVGSTGKGWAALDSFYVSDKPHYIISSICKINVPGKLSLSSSCRSVTTFESQQRVHGAHDAPYLRILFPLSFLCAEEPLMCTDRST